MSMIHLAFLDDHPAVLAGLRRLIEHEPDLLIVGAAPSAPQLARQTGEQHADVLVLDHDLARSDGLAARVAHADAVVSKTDPVTSLLDAIRSVAAGETVLPPISQLAYETATRRLADDDLPVLAMLLGGESLPAIAGALHTDRAEVAWRAQRIIGRLRPGATTRPSDQVVDPDSGRVPELPLP